MADRTERERLVEVCVEALADARAGEALVSSHGLSDEETVRVVLAAADLLSEEGEPRAWETHHRVRENQWWAPPTVRRDTAETIARLHPSATGKIRPLYPGPIQEASDA